MSIETLFEEASERKVESLTDSSIKDISNLCQELLVLQGKIGSKEQELKTLKQKEKELSEQIIPSKLEEFGVLDIKLADGSRISAEPFYAARITAEKTEDAHGWLRKNGHGDIIKNVVSVSFGRGEDDRAKKVMTELFEQGLVSSKDLVNELMNILNSKRDEIVFKMKLTSKDEFEILSKRVENLERKISKLQNLKKKTKRAKKS